MLTRTASMASWGLQLLAAGILIQTLFFKFTAAPESVHIFATLGAEPWGRLVAGIAELVTSVLLLTPVMAPLGALLAAGLMAGAILSHLFVLGIEIQGDGGLLFGLAVVVLASSLGVLHLRRAELAALPARLVP